MIYVERNVAEGLAEYARFCERQPWFAAMITLPGYQAWAERIQEQYETYAPTPNEIATNEPCGERSSSKDE